RHWARISRYRLHMRVVGVKRALHCLPKVAPAASLLCGPALSFFSNLDQLLTDVGPVELWATHSVVQAQRQIHRVLAGPTPPVARERVFRSRLPHYPNGEVRPQRVFPEI